MKIALVPLEHVNDVWDAVKEYLRPAVAVTNGRWTSYDVYVAIQQGAMQLWIAFRDSGEIVGCEVTTVTDYPSKRVLTSLFTGGVRFREWRDLLVETLVRFAKDAECAAIEGHGREGWVKMMQPFGVKKCAVMFEKEV